MASPMPRIPPVTSATCPFMSAMVFHLALHVVPWGVTQGRIAPAAQRGRLYARARPGVGPFGPVLPPGPAVLGARGPPRLGVGRSVLARLVPGLGAGRVDDAGDVAAAGEPVAELAAQQPGGLEGSVPGHDVVVDRAPHVGVVLHRGQRE